MTGATYGPAAAGRLRIAKLTPKQRSELARKGGLVRAAKAEERGRERLAHMPSETVNSAMKRLKAAGRKVTTHALLRETQPDHDKYMELMTSYAGPKTVRSPKHRGAYRPRKH
jgi:hypothetical protein